MGSMAKAVRVGFLCRLCSEHKNKVVHFYGPLARKMNLLEKIKLIPISIEKYDKLPKTVCEACIAKLEKQYQFIKQIQERTHNMVENQADLNHQSAKCLENCPLKGTMLEHLCPFLLNSEVGNTSTVTT